MQLLHVSSLVESRYTDEQHQSLTGSLPTPDQRTSDEILDWLFKLRQQRIERSSQMTIKPEIELPCDV